MIAAGPERYRGLRALDAVEFTAARILPVLTVHDRLSRLVLHPTCSAIQLGLLDPLRRIAEAVADDVIVPDEWGCCGFAGDRGMLHPELTASATASQARELAGVDADAHASCDRTCELGMSRATGCDYEHVLEVLERLTRLTDSIPTPRGSELADLHSGAKRAPVAVRRAACTCPGRTTSAIR
ncbi:(Fe-S)-binding protein [Pseudonocardia xishanensis]|uniref:Cysteine-rich domain-containing protein n=1 Tax=Pseudonocardia xishanensis TaxID=630995 RepID=A0ABP8S0Y1_9PSEU